MLGDIQMQNLPSRVAEDNAHVQQALTKLAFIAPSIVEAILEGRAPAALSLQMLMDNRVSLPLDWKDQERLLKLQQ